PSVCSPRSSGAQGLYVRARSRRVGLVLGNGRFTPGGGALGSGDLATGPDFVGADRLSAVATDEQRVLVMQAGNRAVHALRVEDDEFGAPHEIFGVGGEYGGGARFWKPLGSWSEG